MTPKIADAIARHGYISVRHGTPTVIGVAKITLRQLETSGLDKVMFKDELGAAWTFYAPFPALAPSWAKERIFP